MMWLKTE